MHKELMEAVVEQIGLVKARLVDEGESYEDLAKMLGIALKLIKLANKEAAA